MNLRCLKLYRAYSISFNSLNVGKLFWSWILKGLHQCSGKEKEICCLLFPSSTKRKIRKFHVVDVQRLQRNVQKSLIHVQSSCFACLNLLLFCRSRCRRPRQTPCYHTTTAGLRVLRASWSKILKVNRDSFHRILLTSGVPKMTRMR